LTETFRVVATGHQTEEPAHLFQRDLPNGGWAAVEPDELKKQPQMAAVSLPGAFGQTTILAQMFDHLPDDPLGRT
jgi:hypothetical protein